VRHQGLPLVLELLPLCHQRLLLADGQVHL
jgi:hypothetical protein